MKKTTTIIETSETFESPGGVHRASVSTTNYGPGRAMTQVVVSHPRGGSGLVAFNAPRVDFGLEWRGDDELVVRYPDDLPPPQISAVNSHFGMGGRGRVVYVAAPRSAIEPLQWTREGEPSVTTTTALARGVLVTVTTGEQREYSYAYYDVREADSCSAKLRALGHQGGGPSWEGIVHGLVSLRAQKILPQIEFDAEGDGLAVRSKSRAALLRVAALVAEAKGDWALIEAAIARAVRDGQME